MHIYVYAHVYVYIYIKEEKNKNVFEISLLITFVILENMWIEGLKNVRHMDWMLCHFSKILALNNLCVLISLPVFKAEMEARKH